MKNEVIIDLDNDSTNWCRDVFENIDYKNFVKEAIDLIYITGQQLRERGVDLDAALNEVHRSNLSKKVKHAQLDDELNIARKRYRLASYKICYGDYVLKDLSTGKVIKPTTYSKAVITDKIIGK